MRVQRAVLTNQASVEGFLVFRFEQKYHIARKKWQIGLIVEKINLERRYCKWFRKCS